MTSVDVNVMIDASGKVITATPVGSQTVAQKLPAPQAAQAALLWRFEPARKNGQRVDSETIIKFEFERQ